MYDFERRKFPVGDIVSALGGVVVQEGQRYPQALIEYLQQLDPTRITRRFALKGLALQYPRLAETGANIARDTRHTNVFRQVQPISGILGELRDVWPIDPDNIPHRVKS